MTVFGRASFSCALGAAAQLLPLTASADELVIRRAGAHPDYVFEAEPHLVLGFIDPPGPDVDEDFGIGPGFRGTIEIVDNGFVPSINNSVGVGFGLDWVFYSDVRRCRGPGPRGVCEITGQDVNYFWLPIVLQWNFWLSEQWSVFGEPGFGFRIVDPGDDKFQFIVLYAGGRWRFAERMALTMRAGYPTFSVGVSFLL